MADAASQATASPAGRSAEPISAGVSRRLAGKRPARPAAGGDRTGRRDSFHLQRKRSSTPSCNAASPPCAPATPAATIRDFRNQAGAIRREALAKALASLQRGTSPEEALALLAHTLTNKLIHAPSAQMKQAALHRRPDLIAAARELLALSSTADQP